MSLAGSVWSKACAMGQGSKFEWTQVVVNNLVLLVGLFQAGLYSGIVHREMDSSIYGLLISRIHVQS